MIQFSINNILGIPIYRQLIDQIKYGIAMGIIKPGMQLPTVRQLAVDLSINPNTVTKAYKELELTGLIDTQQGTGTFISNKRIEISAKERKRKIKEICENVYTYATSYGLSIKEIIAFLNKMEEKKNK